MNSHQQQQVNQLKITNLSIFKLYLVLMMFCSACVYSSMFWLYIGRQQPTLLVFGSLAAALGVYMGSLWPKK